MARPWGFSIQLLHLLYFLLHFSSARSDELSILLNFKSSFQNSNINLFNTWNPNSSPCNFTGILCNNNQMVKEINLPNKNLKGNLPLDSICNLQFLEKLDLGMNSISGIISQDLNNCSKLTYLDLSNNLLSGSFPDFSKLSELSFLNLNMTGISGSFPWISLQNLKNLTFLSIGDNSLNPGEFPLEVLKLDKLYWLYLTNCSLYGRIPPGIGNLKKLENLELSTNQLNGEIPKEIGELTKLQQLELYENEFTGKIPVGLRNLSNLINFDASTNKLKGDLSELKYLKNLVSLQLFENEFSGEVPVEFGDFKFLVNLSLYTNKLTGSLPQKLGSWADFDFIDVSSNSFTGPIPPDMCKNGKMKKLLMLQNNFSGGIPENYGSCSSMIRFRVSNNSLSGIVPSGIWGLPNLNFLDLSLNKFEGSLTSDIGNAKSLAQLHINNNRFSGQLPEEITQASSLGLIDISYNQLSGNIPSSLGDLKQLDTLLLQENSISGTIPDSLSSCSHLHSLNLEGNSISGKIPSSLGSLPSLNSLNLARNQLSGHIPSSLSSLKFSLLDLSYNRLTGPIPQALSVDAYKNGFMGNPGLCSVDSNFLRSCSLDSKKSNKLRIIISCLLALITLLLISLAYYFVRRRTKDEDDSSSLKSDSWDLKSFHVLSFSEQDILNAVKQENIIGKGGSGNVYRVVLDNGVELAVKHIWNSDSGNGKSRSSTAILMKRSGNMTEFDAEVATLSSIRHVNVVKLYCSITSEDSSMLVYEYLQNGSLWDRMHTSRKNELDWETRYDIAVGAAKGLEYLHHGCDRPIIHRDVKSSNILLDEFCKPRIADFGLAKILQMDTAKDSTRVITGTHGYIAPEYAYTYKVNEKSDVYSFGVVLMELVTGKRPIEPEFGDNKDIIHWVSTKMTTRESLMSIIDSNISTDLREDAVKVLKIAVLCTSKLPSMRPSMRTVVQMLEDVEPCRFLSIKVDKDGDSIEKESFEGNNKFKNRP